MVRAVALGEVMPIEFHRDGPWELPDGWVWARARDFAHVVGGGTPTNASDNSNFDPNGVPWITPGDYLDTQQRTFRAARDPSPLRGSQIPQRDNYPRGRSLISSRAPVGYSVVAGNDVTTNQGFKSLAFKLPMCAEFFRYYVVYNRKYFVDNASGTTSKSFLAEPCQSCCFRLHRSPNNAASWRASMSIHRNRRRRDVPHPRPRRPRHLAPRPAQGRRHRRTHARVEGHNHEEIGLEWSSRCKGASVTKHEGAGVS